MTDLPPMVVLGVMSGTSLDGVDTVTVRLERSGERLRWEVLGRSAHDYPLELRGRLREALDPQRSNVVLITELHQLVGQFYAQVTAAAQAAAVAAEPAGAKIELVALSGQTVYHIPRPDPQRGWSVKSTLQLGEAAVVTQSCRVPTVAEFRQSDIAAGGQGAPLVSFSDHLLYSRPGVARAVLNIGGIANLTYLPADGDPAGVRAFDSGPGNCLLDEAAQRFLGLERDEAGGVAAGGRVDEQALARLLADPYFHLPTPKTTGREYFHLDWALERGWPTGEEVSPADLLATLTRLTAVTVARAVEQYLPTGATGEVLVAGGGARNAELMAGLQTALSLPAMTFAELGYDDKDRETLAMAVMGYMAYHGEPNVLPAATGARYPLVAGKLCRP
ncbi:MAG TPA: anhydro-N-acetylmuramic acid kinase [Trueperaceae bacterium]|nr:anhydro-N-acetylmuramic acid kinase [Trueperaceae bacterium]